MKIGVFDSGIGGLTTLEEIRKLLPNEDYIYFKDSKHNPYGEKSEEELYSIVKNVVDRLIENDVKLIVIACNTATTRCVDRLRREYSIPFVATVPAVKVAIDSNYKNILVMATPGTISSEKLHAIINENKDHNQNIMLVPCEGLANAIEFSDENKIDEILNNIYLAYKDSNIDSIVLGCTHYVIIKDKIKKIFNNLPLIDGNRGVANRVKYLLEENGMISNSNDAGNLQIIEE